MARIATTAALEWDNVSFAYPTTDTGQMRTIVRNCTYAVPAGSFCLLTGDTGAGKTTLLRLAKPEVAPAGTLTGTIRVAGVDTRGLDVESSARRIGYVGQNPSEQLVCNTVWHEVAFGLECLGTPAAEMRRRVAEVCTFLGMGPLMERSCDELSGGEAQLVALASALVTEPEVLLLDEPTSMLDPLARDNFAHALFRLVHEAGMSVVLATHDPAPLVSYADCAIHLEEGKLSEVPLESDALKNSAPLLETDGNLEIDAQALLASRVADKEPLRAAGIWMRYKKQGPWVLKNCDLEIEPGTIHALIGSNGSGKSSLVRAVSGLEKLQRGRVTNPWHASQVMLPQDPEVLFGATTAEDDLMAWADRFGYSRDDIEELAQHFCVGELLERDAFDGSRGQRQALALCKVFACKAQLLLLDEPTRGLDRRLRTQVCRELVAQKARGATTLLITHDLELVREVADVVSLMFCGEIACTTMPEEFFAHNRFFR